MNVSLRKFIIPLLVLISVPFLADAQSTVELETYLNNPVTHTFSSSRSPSVLSSPANGTAEVVASDMANQYELIYTPNDLYVGLDELQIAHHDERGNLRLSKIFVTVRPSKVEASNDFAFTLKDVSVEIDVTANDFGSSGGLGLSNILLVNNGSTQFTVGEGKILFTPLPGFAGIAQFNYTVCDTYGSCDQGSVTISVKDLSGNERDTTRIFTKRNAPQVIFIPDDFELTAAPANGTIDEAGSIPEYVPDQDYVGFDYAEFTGQGTVQVIEVIVLDTKENLIAFDDQVFTTSGRSVEIEMLKNDKYAGNSGCFEIASYPQHGSLRRVFKGYYLYTPNDGFEGIDRFTYSIQDPNCKNQPEVATVFVHVSNFRPAASKYFMVTPKRTPLIIGYDVPISNFNFQVTAQGELGSARFLEEGVDTLIYGQLIQGNNIIVYVPDQNVDSGTDEFEIVYCVESNGTCQTEKTVKIEVEILDIGDDLEPLCFDDCIWAGDTNLDGIVNMADLLPIGVHMGDFGRPRDDVEENVWFGQFGEDWGISLKEKTAVDLKHVDTNGDSLISAVDTAAISKFYGRTHALTAERVVDYQHSIKLEGDIFAYPGDVVELDMVLGSEDDLAVDVYGFTFPFEYNPDFFEPESVKVEFKNQSWLAYNSPVLFMSKNDNNGLVETGFTRTNGVPTSGFGPIGKVRFIVVDDINGLRPGEEEITVELGNTVATAINSRGQSFGVQIEGFTLHILLDRPEEDPVAEEEEVPLENKLKVFPNPVSDLLNVHLNGGREFERLLITDMTGRRVFDSGTVQQRRMEVDVSNLMSGFYLLQVQTQDDIINKKVEIIN